MNTIEIINNLDNLTLGHLFKIVRKIKITVLVSIGLLFSSIIGGVYALGRNAQQEETAVTLNSPFSMRFKIDSVIVSLENLMLIKDPTIVSASEDLVLLSLREIRSDFDVIPIGSIVARVEPSAVSWPWSLFSSAYAQTTIFNWNGHREDRVFKEKFVEENTIHRKYRDGCILEYKVDEQRKSIPESFKWYKRTH